MKESYIPKEQRKKVIQINIKIHEQLKQYCDDNGLKMQKLIEKLIINEINRNLQNNESNK